MDSSKKIKVMCPKHKNELAIEREKLLIFGKDYPVIIGTCGRCKEKYLSRRLFASNDSCVIKGQQYYYLNELEAIYEDFLRLERIAEQRAKEEERKRQREIAERIKAEKEAEARRIKEEAERKKREAEEKIKAEKRAERERAEAEHKAKLEMIEAKLSEKERKIQSGELKAFRAKKLMYLPKTPKFCYADGRKVLQINMTEFSDYKIRCRAWCCVKCSTVYFLNQDRNEIAKCMMDAQVEPVAVQEKLNKRGSEITCGELVNHAIPQNILYICKGIISCKKHGHSVESATGVVIGKNGNVIKLNTNYCPQCKKYFIGYDEYIRYRSIYGTIMGNIKITNGSFVPFDGDLAQESILHLCGYSVNQSDNLSAGMRQQILQYLIDSRIMSKPEIISYLNGFIRRNGKRANMGEAVRRWESDIQWVRNYKLSRQRHFEIVNILKNR